MDKLTSSILHLYFTAHLQHLRVHCMNVSNHTIGSWQLHMTSEILYTYIWRTEEVIKPYGPLPYSRKHSTNLLTWFIITLCHLAKPTLQLFERKKLAKRRERTCTGSCGSGNPEWFYMPAAIQGSQDLAGSTRNELVECKLPGWVCEASWQQEKQMDVSSACMFTSGSVLIGRG